LVECGQPGNGDAGIVQPREKGQMPGCIRGRPDAVMHAGNADNEGAGGSTARPEKDRQTCAWGSMPPGHRESMAGCVREDRWIQVTVRVRLWLAFAGGTMLSRPGVDIQQHHRMCQQLNKQDIAIAASLTFESVDRNATLAHR